MQLSEFAVDAFNAELEKIAGKREALKVLLTGRVPIYHGTSKRNARSILDQGLRPQGSRGITTHFPEVAAAEQGLAFGTRNREVARVYARQASGLDKGDKLKRLVPERYRKAVHRLVDKHAPTSEMEELGHKAVSLTPARVLQLTGLSRGRVVRADVPRRVLSQVQGIGRELHVNPVALRQREGLRQVHPKLEQATAANFVTDVPLKDTLGPQYMRGGRKYERVSLKELRQHLQDARSDPKGLAKDVLRSWTGISHRPSTLLRQG